MGMLENIVIVGLSMLLLIFLFILFVCKPWRFLFSSYPTPSIKVDDLERPLVQEDSIHILSGCNKNSKSKGPEDNYIQREENSNIPRAHDLSAGSTHLTQGSCLVLDINDQSEDITIGQTLKRPLLRNDIVEETKCGTKEHLNYDLRFREDDVKFQKVPEKGSFLLLEVIAGPACGLRYSVRSTDTCKLPVTIGRVLPSDLVLKDSEVSGKHAMINWNSDNLKWELVDMGSLNGTLLNSKAVHHPNIGSRNWGEPNVLVTGDVLTFGTTSQIKVQITSLSGSEIPFGVGIASDPMSMRLGGKKLPMEDVCFYKWPLPGAIKFAVFGICDGHGGALAAQSVSKILPERIANILSDPSRRETVLSQQDASEVLREAFSQTEACLDHYYEGCTATVLLICAAGHRSLFAQCANVGDSACVMNIDGKQVKMTEDHRITSYLERQRINKIGDSLKDGDTRMCGLNLGRMLGDKFLKEQDARFSSQPYISEAIHINQGSEAFALLASDGLWDVISVKKSIQLVLQAKEKESSDRKDSAMKMANMLLAEAKSLRTKDNTSVVYVDFDAVCRALCKYDS